MPVLLDTAQFGSAAASPGWNGLTIGLVNNMPDRALEATERQFVDLLRAAATDVAVRFKLFSIPDLPRAERKRRELARRYRDISGLWDTRLDGLIVTGTEPRAAALADEPYWASFGKLVAWARHSTVSTIWSCLAAHAAVLHADGIERKALAEKQFGVFDCEKAAAHPLLRDMPAQLRVPHSRLNDLPAPALAASGYRLLTRGPAIGVDAFVREQQNASLFVFFQGHLEYEADTLAREFRRDVGRFLRGEREHFPTPPRNYLSEEATALVDAFRARAAAARRASLMTDFPMRVIAAGVDNTWRAAAVAFYANWLAFLAARVAERRAPPGANRLRRVSAPSGRRRSADAWSVG